MMYGTVVIRVGVEGKEQELDDIVDEFTDAQAEGTEVTINIAGQQFTGTVLQVGGA